MDPFMYRVHCAVGARKLEKLLEAGSGYEVSVQKGEKFEGIFIDTFENQLQKASMLLILVGKILLLVDLKKGQLIEQATDDDQWRFASELCDGPITSELVKISKLRAFLPVAEVEFRVDQGLLLDDESKTRARFRNVVFYNKKNTVSVGTTQYLRGYHKAHTDLIGLLKDFGAQNLLEMGDIYGSLGIDRQVYNAKPLLALQGEDSARQTATTIIRTFIKIARANETGVMADYDTEFLHDYRVSFRKVRSVLSLFKGVYNREDTAELKADFASIMRITNRLRDLDVYLLERDNYFNLVPETSHKGLRELFSYLQKERKRELKIVTRNFKSGAYKKQQRELWNRFGKKSTLSSGPKADHHAKKYGSRLILKRYTQVCRIAGTIDANTADEVVHQLRINCKKLRYLIEFFTPLFPPGEIKNLIKALKKLQDNLGKFNDYSVQQGFLRQIMQTELPAFKEHELQVTEAIGALTAMLFRLQLKERNQVMKNFARFDSFETRALFKDLFQDGGAR